MNTQKYTPEPEDAIKKVVRRTTLETPSAGFTERLMDRILVKPEPVSKWVLLYQWGVLGIAASVAVLMLVFPAWTVFDFDMSMAAASARDFFSGIVATGLTKAGQMLSSIGPIGKYAYFIPVSIALLVVSVFDQIIRYRDNKHEVVHPQA